MSGTKDLKKKISPKAISALIMEDANRLGSPRFIKTAYQLVFIHPEKLTEGWVKRINKWAKDTIKDMSLDSDFEQPQKGEILKNLGPLKIIKVISRHSKRQSLWSGEKFYDYIAVDENGWKYWLRVYKLTRDLKQDKDSFPKRGENILLESAMVRDNRTGITFLAQIRGVQILKEEE